MSTFKSALDRVPGFFRYLLILAVIAFISFLFPSNVRFKYDFDQGQTWRYESLDAPFDFAIKKPQAQVEAEMAELESDFRPYYELRENMPAQKQEAFNQAFQQQLEQVNRDGQFAHVLSNTSTYRNYGQSYLRDLYAEGVLRLDPKHQDAESDFQINVVSGNIIKRRPLRVFERYQQVLSRVGDTLRTSDLQEPDFLYPILQGLIEPNVVYNDSLTKRFREDLMASVTTTQGLVRKGERIVNQGAPITDEVYMKLLSLKEQYEQDVTANQSRLSILVGYFLLTSLIIGVFILYLRNFAPDIFNRFAKLLFIFLWLVAYSYLVSAVERADVLSAYLIPFCIVPIVIKTFYDVRLALFTHIVVVLIASFLSSLGYEFTFLQILAGIVVILTDVDTRDWSRFFYSMLWIFVTYALAFFGLSLIQEGTWNEVDWRIYTWIFLNVFLTLLAYPLIPLLERLFGFTSSISLVELSDMNRPLLSKLAIDAPGTLQHSIQVANLSESAARKIGADHLLVKVAALYHDIGKTKNPAFFIENQNTKNPHEELTQKESAEKIIEHVTYGEELAKKSRLPKVIIDFIRTHHGTTRVEYFYRKYAEANPEKASDDAAFRYPGPRPRTKEESILMMADSIEAACKSLKEPTAQAIDDLIDKIISHKISQHQLDESTMTFEELENCRQVFRQVMKSVHHVRIEYPDEQKKQ
jgi:cyclic-di-AMP phosphodiesterase PgpH